MKKRLMAVALVLCCLFGCVSPSLVHATETDTCILPSYGLYQNFMTKSYPILYRDRLYLMALDAYTGYEWCLNGASWLLEEDLSVDRCTEILANLATLMNYQLEEAIMEQASIDTTMTLLEYGVNAAEIASGVVGSVDALKKAGDVVMQRIAATIGIANGVADFTFNTIKDLELLIQLEADYSMQYDFLQSVYLYAELPEMKEAARQLLLVNQEIMLRKLEVFNSELSNTVKFAAHDIFLDPVAKKLLTDPDFVNSEAGFAVKALSTVYDLFSGAKLGFDITIFLGDVLVGVHDIYNRYNEMVALRDIRQALLSRVAANPVLNEDDYDGLDHNISLLKMALYVDARGEYCIYKMLTEDGKLLTLTTVSNGKSIEENYNDSIDIITGTFEILGSLYIEELLDDLSVSQTHYKRLTQINKYDEAGNLESERVLHYNQNDQISEIEIRSYGEYDTNSKTVLTYDEMGRLISRKSSEFSGVNYSYNSSGQLVKVISWEGGGGEALYEYDTNGNIVKVTEKYDIGTYITEYTYDASGNRTGAITLCTEEGLPPWQETTAYTYDSEQRLTLAICEGGYSKTTHKYDYTFVNMTLVEYLVNGERDGVFAYYYDISGNDACGLYLRNPQFYADADGYLAKVVDTYTSHQGRVETATYEFCYDQALAVPLDMPTDTTIHQDPVVSHTYDEAEKLLYAYLVGKFGSEGLQVRQVTANGRFEMTISGKGGAPIYVINWYTVDLDTGEVRNAETDSVVCDLW